MKQLRSTLNEMRTIIKCTNPNKHELKKHCKPNLMEQQLVTPFDMEQTHHRQHPLVMSCNYSHSSILWD